MKNEKTAFEIRQIDAWKDFDDMWTWNDSFHIDTFKTAAENEKRAFLYALHKLNITCKRGKCVIVDDGYCLELQDRKTGEPLFAAIPMDF